MSYISKDDERKALDKIRKIIDTLGADSYVAAAFDGCFEVAEQNIDNDWACSLKGQIESLNAENDRLHHEIGELKHDVQVTKGLNNLGVEVSEKQKSRIKELEEKRDSLMGEVVDATNEKIQLKGELEDAQNEIIQLKAKLYDLMSK